MNTRRRIVLIASIATLFALFLIFLEFCDQPYYHSGIGVKLLPDGFRVTAVASGSEAHRAGLRSGMIVTELGGYGARELDDLSVSDVTAFLHVSTDLFRLDSGLALLTDSGSRYLLPMSRQPWATRAPLLSREVLSNLIVGALFVLSGIWLLSIGKGNGATLWFSAFADAAAVAITCSFFSSYWSGPFLAARFALLDVSGAFSICFLAGFFYRFPDAHVLRPYRLLAVPLAFLGVKYALVASGAADPYARAAYALHAFMAVGLFFVLSLLVRRYRETSAGGKRKLRWIFAGVGLSVSPYLYYVVSVLFRPSLLSSETEILNYVASFSLVMFPVFVIIAVVRYSLFDIDRLLDRFTVFFFLAFIATVAYTACFMLFFESTLSLEIYFSLLATALAAPWLYLRIDSGVQRFLWKGRKDKNHILLEMEQELNGLVMFSEVYPVVGSAMMSAFSPSSIVIARVDGGVETSDYRYPPGSEAGGYHDGGVRLRLGTMDGAESVLRLGKKADGDIYTKYDMLLLHGACAQIEKALDTCGLYVRLQESIRNESKAQRTAILTLAKLTEYRDNETGRHLERIREYTRLIADRYRIVNLEAAYLTAEYIDALCLSSILHDIGKVGIPDAILLKPGPLTPEEFAVIKRHSSIGGRVLEEAEAMDPERSFLTIGKLVAYHHHEKWDGTGYPLGLTGAAIPLSARIVAVADVYDALRSHRPYKPAFSHAEALAIIADGRGRHFDPDLVDVFMDIEGYVEAIPRET